MDFWTCIMVNGPFCILTIMINAFFIFCMICPIQGEKIKQPLKLLLWTLICCTITFLMSVLLQFYAQTDDIEVMITIDVVFVFSLSTSMTSSVWLNFFYYTQIVPAQRAICIWIKKNIKPIIYCIWLVEKMLSMFNVGAFLVYYITLSNLIPDMASFNSTFNYDIIYFKMPSLQKNVCVTAVSIVKAHFIFCLCVMAMSSGSTVIYLGKHMRRMVTNGQPLTCPRFRSQVRVTVTGMLQGVLYVFCAMWTVYKYFVEDNLSGANSGYTFSHFTVINLYMAGTTFNLGAGQAAFRQRAADIWLRAVQCCRVRQSEQGA